MSSVVLGVVLMVATTAGMAGVVAHALTAAGPACASHGAAGGVSLQVRACSADPCALRETRHRWVGNPDPQGPPRLVAEEVPAHDELTRCLPRPSSSLPMPGEASASTTNQPSRWGERS
jgi:hypothetical protein